MKLYEAHFETRDGEHEYTQKEFIFAPDMDAAVRHFVDFLETYFGDETVVTERSGGVLDGMVKEVENTWGTLSAKIDWLAETNGFTVGRTDGGYERVSYLFLGLKKGAQHE